MTRSYMATHNLIAVSANLRETAINTEKALDTTMLAALGDVINLEHRRESNENEAIGKEEPDTLYDLGSLANWSANFEKAQPQHFAFLLAYALGVCASAAAGSGYQHTITPIDGDLDGDRSMPSFTAAQRYGDIVLRRRFASMFVDAVTANFAKDSWCKITGTIKGTGKYTDNVTKENVTAEMKATTLTLAANAVEDDATPSAAKRLENVQQVRCLDPNTGEYKDVAYSAVSAATPAVITITPPATAVAIEALSKAAACVVTWTGHGLLSGNKVTIAGITQADWSALNAEHTITKIGADSFVESTDATYEVLYIPTESGWMTFPARINETPLRVSQMTLKVGGKWNGTSFLGGRAVTSEIKSVDWSFNNALAVEFVPGAGGTYASKALRGGRTQKLALNREFREFIMQQHLIDNDTLGLYILAEGAVYDSPHKYQVEIIFPKVAVLAAPISADGKRLGEAGDLQVLEDDTYGSVIVKVKNLQATYAA
ncbi:MAG: hypothetical protein NTY86_13240 [Deltaproteobacteria bacterium]|nr:hypothetical protein [Deltaproteobacteria bacterium]